jgi:hypothetical protein
VALLGGTAISQPIAGQGWRVDVTIPLREPLASEEPVLVTPSVNALVED